VVAELAKRWAAALEATPASQRGTHFLRERVDGVHYRHSPLGILANVVMPDMRTLVWTPAHERHFLTPLVGAPQTVCLTNCVVKHCRLRHSDPGFSSGSLPILALARKGLSFEHLANLIRTYASEL
jgi:hypothetical protein